MPAPTDPTADGPRPHLDLVQGLALAFLLIAAWLATRHYSGVTHDAVLYSFLALFDPGTTSPGHELFVGRGSQGSFTAYPWLFAELVARSGLQHAHLLVTAASNLLVLWAAWFLSGRMSLGKARWPAILLFMLAPGYYGAENIFRYAEPFATPRTAAEACVLAALALALSRRKTPLAWAALATILAIGFAMHPLMALPGALACLGLLVLEYRGRLPAGAQRVAVAAIAVLAVTLAALLERMDAAWLTQVRNAVPYVFLSEWSLLDWQRLVVPVCTLVYVTWVLPPESPAWRLALCGLALGVLGVMVAWVGSDLLAISLVVQGQAWRWLWVTKAVALLALAPALAAGWRAGGLMRVAAALLAVGWLGTEDALGMPVALIAVLLAAVARNGARLTAARAVAAWSIPAAALFLVAPASSLLDDGLRFLGYAALAWAVLDRRPLVVTGGAAIVAMLLGRHVADALDSADTDAIDLSESRMASFADFRERIPPSASVLSPANVTTIWLLLRRASYVSSEQAAAGLFSRDAALEIERRAQATSGLQSVDNTLVRHATDRKPPAPLTAALHDRLCALRDVDFVIGHEPIDRPRMIHPQLFPEPNLYLYPCRSGVRT